MLAYPGSPADQAVAFPDVPGIAKQTPWPAGIYDFGALKSPNMDYFNCTLVRRPDGLWLIVRRARNVPGMTFGMNDLVAFRLDNNVPALGIPIKLERRFADEQFEDPRVVYHEGRTVVSCCDFVWTSQGWSGAHQIVTEMGNDWTSRKRYDPEYGNNGPQIGKNTGHEKNWLWFFHEGRPHMIYSASPHVVVRFTPDYVKENEHYTECDTLPWTLGQLRGGTPPVLVNGEYWTFFHSSTQWQKPRRRYHMGAYAFEAEAPFRMTRMTDAPLLSGSRFDPMKHPKPLVVFPGGSEYRDGQWLVVMGINDHLCGWIQIPHAELEKRMVSVIQKPSTLKNISDKIIRALHKRRPRLENVTLVCVDDRRPDLAELAIEQCKNEAVFKDIKFFTSDIRNRDAVEIPPIRNYEDYCRFLIKDLNQYITTSHVLVVQWDGYIINGDAWRDEWLQYDYIGSPWVGHGLQVGNGGFSLRSKKLLTALQHATFRAPFMPEDQYICEQKREHLDHQFKMQFAPTPIALQFSIENGLHDKQFGFHSFLTRFDKALPIRPKVFHHSGDLGDIIYALPSIKAAGGGVLFLSPENDSNTLPNWPPRQRMSEAVAANLCPLLDLQPYIWKSQYTGYYPVACDFNLNNFRRQYGGQYGVASKPQQSLLQMQSRLLGVTVDETQAWLTVDMPVFIYEKPIVINRSARYHNPDFPWKHLVSHYGKRMVFLGTADEYSEFTRAYGFVDYMPTTTLLDAARIIAGCRLYIGNQSALMAIAMGLGSQLIQEVWLDDPNCILNRKNAVYQRGGVFNLNTNWL